MTNKGSFSMKETFGLSEDDFGAVETDTVDSVASEMVSIDGLRKAAKGSFSKSG